MNTTAVKIDLEFVKLIIGNDCLIVVCVEAINVSKMLV
jgi:hypothetical protein